MRLEGKVAVITGAAVGIKGELMNFGGGSGWRFVEEGARVVLTDIDDERGEKRQPPISAKPAATRSTCITMSRANRTGIVSLRPH